MNFVGPKKVTLTYVAGSARMFSNALPKDGSPLKDDASLMADGALLGDKQDGYLGQNSGYLLFNVRATLG